MGSNISREAVIRISYKNKPFLELERHDSDGASKLNLFFIQGGMIPRYLQSLILFRYRISREAESCSYQNYPVLESERHDSERATKRNLFLYSGRHDSDLVTKFNVFGRQNFQGCSIPN